MLNFQITYSISCFKIFYIVSLSIPLRGCSTSYSPHMDHYDTCRLFKSAKLPYLLLNLPSHLIYLKVPFIDQFGYRHQLIPLIPKACNDLFQRLCCIFCTRMQKYNRAVTQLLILYCLAEDTFHPVVLPVQTVTVRKQL